MQHALVAYLVNAVWQVPLIVTGAVLVSRLAGLSPQGRNLAWLGFLAMSVIAPAVPAYHSLTDPRPLAAPSAMAQAKADAAPPAAADNLDRASGLHLLRLELRPSSAALIRLAFVTATAIGVARLALGTLGAVRLVRRSREAVLSAPVVAALQAFGQTHQRPVPSIRSCSGLSCPVVVGALKPVILIPAGFTALSEGDQHAALLHEFSHVVRRDYAVNLMSELAALPLGWHPAIYALKSGIRRSRELACDAMAAASMSSQKAYARRLLSLAKSMSAPTHASAPAMVGLFGRSDLEDRLRHLLAAKGAEPGGLKAARLSGAAAITALALTPAVLFRVTPALAEAPQPPAPTATAMAPSPAALAAPAAPASPAAPAAAGAPAHPRARAACPERRHAGSAKAAAASTRRVTGILITPDGEHLALSSDDDSEQVSTQVRGAERQAEDAARRAAERAAAAHRLIDSPEFKQRLADIAARQADLAAAASKRAEQQVEAALARNDVRLKQAMARAQAQIDTALDREAASTTERIQRQVEKSLNKADAPAD